ncbi:MAG: zinc-binding dehydrogenase [Micropepsaceae bacterium]
MGHPHGRHRVGGQDDCFWELRGLSRRQRHLRHEETLAVGLLSLRGTLPATTRPQAAFKAAAPKGYDIYFDNVGGETLDAAILNMHRNGRIVVSGQISEYNTTTPRGIRHTLPFITQRLRMEGMVVYDHAVQFDEARRQMAEWVNEGRLTWREEIIEGIEKAPEAFIGLFSGDSFGRRLVHVG